jgi:hypothetical protein
VKAKEDSLLNTTVVTPKPAEGVIAFTSLMDVEAKTFVVPEPPAATTIIGAGAKTFVVPEPPAPTVIDGKKNPPPAKTTVRRGPASPTPATSTGGRAKKELPSDVRDALGDPEKRLGKYVFVRELGRGGMGVVHEAYDTALGRYVAIKLILDPSLVSAELLERFHREAAAAGRLRHAGIVAVHEVGEQQGRPFIVMELVKGESLESLLRREKVSPKKVAELVRQVAAALAYAHEQGIIHRDVKPENVLVDREGRPHLMDFGLARDAEQVERLTATGQILGTPAYMAPEQARGDVKAQGPQSDVYGLGGILYRALTGKLPFTAKSVESLFHKVLHEDPTPPRKLRPEIHADLETITLRCLAKELERRYRSASEVADELARFVEGEPIHARRISRIERAVVWARRNRTLAAALAALALVCGAGAGLGAVAAIERFERRAAVLRVIEHERSRAREGAAEVTSTS